MFKKQQSTGGNGNNKQKQLVMLGWQQNSIADRAQLPLQQLLRYRNW